MIRILFYSHNYFRIISERDDFILDQKLTNLDAKGAKRSVKMWATNFYKSYFKNILLYMSIEQSAVKKPFSIYACYAPDGLFWLNL